MNGPNIPYGWHNLSAGDIEAVVSVLKSAPLTQGEEIGRFEAAVAGYCGAGHAVAVSSGSAALLLACRALGLGPGALLWTSPVTFVATAASALHLGAEVGFVDIDPATGNLDADVLERRLIEAEGAGRLPDIVIPVHYAGRACDMRRIAALSERFGFRVIEDACHALGASYRVGRVGDCRYSDITVFSFHPVKAITTGEGGMAVTRDAALATRMRRLRNHGMVRDPAEMSEPPEGGWCYEIVEAGYNFRLTDLQAALGSSQLRRLDAFVERRRCLAMRYHALLEGLPLRLPACADDHESAWHLYVVQLQDTHRRGPVHAAMQAAGIGVAVHYKPLYRQPLFSGVEPGPHAFPGAERFYAGALSLPLHPGMDEATQDRVVSALREALA